jgi:antitoxin MazE
VCEKADERTGAKDEVDVVQAEDGAVSFEKKRRREEALARLARQQWKLPPDYRFDREEANARDSACSDPALSTARSR